jgi:DNA-binding transcriptional LysR family regulator
MELKWLEDFVMLAREGSFSRAAALRNVTQPAYSRRIRALEHWLGVTLIDRSASPVTLTSYGEEFLPHARQIIGDALAVRQDFQLAQSADKQLVRLVTLHTLSITLVPSLVVPFLQERPRARLEILPSIQGLDTHFDALDSGAAHVLIAYGRARNGRKTSAYEELTLSKDAFVPVATPGFIEGRGGPGFPKAKESVPHISYRAFTFSHGYIAPMVETLPISLHHVVECSLSETQKALLLQGIGFGWLPRSCVAAELASGALIQALDDRFVVPVDVQAVRLANLTHPMALLLWRTLVNRDARIAASCSLGMGQPTSLGTTV